MFHSDAEESRFFPETYSELYQPLIEVKLRRHMLKLFSAPLFECIWSIHKTWVPALASYKLDVGRYMPVITKHRRWIQEG